MEKLEPSILRKYLVALGRFSELKAIEADKNENLEAAKEHENIKKGCMAILRHVPYSVDDQVQYFKDEIHKLEAATKELSE